MILAAKACSSIVGGYLWVAVGNTGQLSTSESGTASSWTARTSSFGTTDILFVKSDGFGSYVAVGNAGKLATSPDAITWTQRTSSFSTSNITGVAYGNGVWVAVGASGKLATATDPTGTWTQRTTGFSGSVDITGIYYGNGIWVAINASGEIRTATDPTSTWTLRTSTLTAGNMPPRYNTTGSIWTAGIDGNVSTGALASSTDGITWTARNTPNTTSITPRGYVVSNSTIIVVAYLMGSFDYATSTDGITWTDRTPATSNASCGQGAVDANGFMVIPRASGTVETSSDGITWTSRTGPASVAVSCICHSSGG